MRGPAIAVLATLGLSACLGTTGNSIVHFQAAAAGPPDAVAGKPLEFTSGLGWHVVLTKATLHVGAMYLVQTLPTSGGGPAPCILQGTYVAEVTTDPGPAAGIDVDLLSSSLQYFPNGGQGTDIEARAGQIWLARGPIDAPDDGPMPVLDLAGTAELGGRSIPFVAAITIGRNRVPPPTDATKPDAEPVCQFRIVSPILVDLVPRSAGVLTLRVDPRQLFVDTDFSALIAVSTSPPLYTFGDDANGESATLYSVLHSGGPVYRFEWEVGSP
jgi:hypothetical protein